MARPAYLWEDSARRLAVSIAQGVASTLALQAFEALKAIPRRGLEIGGILTGRIEASEGCARLMVEDYTPVESEHRAGPSYRLSEADRERFRAVLRGRPDAVGLYRTQTRSDQANLEDDDRELFRESFGERRALYLLIVPAQSKAVILLPAGGGLEPVHEMPFRGTALPARESRAPEPGFDAEAQPGPGLHAFSPPVPPPSAGTTFRRAAPAAAALLVGFAAGAVISRPRPRPQPEVASSPPAQTPAPVPVEDPGAVPGHLERHGSQIRFIWDRDAAAVRSGDRATLYITDGPRSDRVDLDRRELRSGMLVYWPDSPDVSFRLEVKAGGPTVSESVRAERAAPDPPRPAAKKLSPFPDSVAVATARVERPAESTPAAVAAPAPVVREAARVDDFAPPPPRLPGSSVAVTAEPVRKSRSKIPLLGRLRRKKPAFQPPKPLHEETLQLTPGEARRLSGEVPVDVKVYVTETGKVQFAELLSIADRDRDLAASAVYSARRWSFTPARLGSEAVPGEVIQHYRFSPVR